MHLVNMLDTYLVLDPFLKTEDTAIDKISKISAFPGLTLQLTKPASTQSDPGPALPGT